MSIHLIKNVAVDLGVSVQVATRLATTASKRYKKFVIPKKRGGIRQVAQPAREVKALQRSIVRHLTALLPMHEAATAYRPSLSILDNAARHAHAKYLLKLDFATFFPSISTLDIRQHLRRYVEGISESELAFVAASCAWRERPNQPYGLCIGAPSSPFISNTVLFDFDCRMAERAAEFDANYTRYSDDITISSLRPGALREIEATARALIEEIAYPRLTFNESKRVAVSRAAAMRVTGLTLANDGRVTVGRIRKRGVRAGVKAYLEGRLDEAQKDKLRGELAFVLNIEPFFRYVLWNTYGQSVAPLLPIRADA